MSISLLSQTKNICQELNLEPTKSKGQNFLIESNIVDNIIVAAGVNKQDTVLEIGPGLGVLTQELIQCAQQVIAVELDKKLFLYLKSRFDGVKNLELVEGDILKLLNINGLKQLPPFYKVVANLPYQITSYVLRLLLKLTQPPSEVVVMVQKEVADRICALPGQMSVLAVMVQYYSQPEIVGEVVKDNFWPIPKVDSALLKLKINTKRDNKINEALFFKLVKLGFISKRKMLKNNLGNIYGTQKIKQVLIDLGLDSKIRAQELKMTDWFELYKQLPEK